MDSFFLNFIKYSLFVYNVILAISGIILIAGGAIVLKNMEGLASEMPSSTTAPAVVLIFAGIIVFVVSVIGCCGVLRESYILLMVFGALLTILFIILVAVGVTAAVTRDNSPEDLRSDLEDSMKNYNKKRSSRKFWDKAQRKYECCGIDRATDWKDKFEPDKHPHFTKHPKSKNDKDSVHIPKSCCPRSLNITIIGCIAGKSSYPDGCLDKIYDKMKSASTTLMGIGIGIAIFLVIGIVLSFWLAIELKREYDDDDYE